MTKKELINILAAIDDDDQVRLTSETGYGYEYQVEWQYMFQICSLQR